MGYSRQRRARRVQHAAREQVSKGAASLNAAPCRSLVPELTRPTEGALVAHVPAVPALMRGVPAMSEFCLAFLAVQRRTVNGGATALHHYFFIVPALRDILTYFVVADHLTSP